MRARSGSSTELPDTLSDLGITKNTSSEAQRLAAIPEPEFEGMLGEWRERVAIHCSVGAICVPHYGGARLRMKKNLGNAKSGLWRP